MAERSTSDDWRVDGGHRSLYVGARAQSGPSGGRLCRIELIVRALSHKPAARYAMVHMSFCMAEH